MQCNIETFDNQIIPWITWWPIIEFFLSIYWDMMMEGYVYSATRTDYLLQTIYMLRKIQKILSNHHQLIFPWCSRSRVSSCWEPAQKNPPVRKFSLDLELYPSWSQPLCCVTLSGAQPENISSADCHVSGGTPKLVSGCGFVSVSDWGGCNHVVGYWYSNIVTWCLAFGCLVLHGGRVLKETT